MSYTVTIKFNGVGVDAADLSAEVCRFFAPKNAYIDMEAYEGTVYDTNVDGFGAIEPMEPFASTGVPFPVALAQFKLAMVGENNEVEFKVDDYKEAFYYKTLGAQMADQGFEVTVEEDSEDTEES